MPWRRSPTTGLLLVALWLLVPGAGSAQVGAVAVERENFRATPGGTILAEVLSGTELRLGPSSDRWREASLEGWVWAPSVRQERRDGHDLVVAPPEGENLRAGPSGEMIARLRTGMRLTQVETRGNWILVRRTGWIWQPSLSIARPATPPPSTPSVATPVASTPSTPTAGAGSARNVATAGPAGLTLLTRPAGDTLARIHRGGTVEVLEQDGDWARVRVEGWTSMAAPAPPDTAGTLRNVSRSDLARSPDRFRGRLIEWPVQFIALQHAERFRTDFAEGEPFILARGPGDDPGFVYVAVPADRLEEVRALAPLEHVGILARVRAARSTLTEAPVLELLEITRGARR